MADSNLMPQLAPQFLDAEGLPLSGGKLYTKLASSPSTDAPTYTDEDLLVPHTNPIILDEFGMPVAGQVWLNPTVRYYMDLRDANDVPVRTFAMVFDPLLKQKAKAPVIAGNPNGTRAGTAGVVGGVNADMVWDNVSGILYVCTTTGDALTAVWTATTGTFPGLIAFSGAISPTAISTDQDNYNPTDLSSASIIRQNLGAAAKINGLAGGTAGRIITIHNISNDYRLTLTNQAGTSDAANRFLLSEDVFIDPNKSITLQYDGITGRWRMFAPPLRAIIGGTNFLENCSIVATVGSNALTIALKTSGGLDPTPGDPIRVAFRKSPITDGGFVMRSVIAATSLVISSGSTLGFTASEVNNLHVCLIDNNGTVELAVTKDAGVVRETTLISTTAEGGSGGADTSGTIYSSTARASVAIRLAGILTIATGATPGQWGSNPTKISLTDQNVLDPHKGTQKAAVSYVTTTATAIKDSMNVSGLTDVGTGETSIAFAVAFSNAFYFVACAEWGASMLNGSHSTPAAPSVGGFDIVTASMTPAVTDADFVSAIVSGRI